MEYALIVWAIGTLPAIAGGMTGLGIMFTALLVILQAISFVEDWNLKLLRYLWITIPMWVVGAIIPDEETAYAMAAAYGVQQVVENDKVQEIAKDGADVLQAYLKAKKQELEGTK